MIERVEERPVIHIIEGELTQLIIQKDADPGGLHHWHKRSSFGPTGDIATLTVSPNCPEALSN